MPGGASKTLEITFSVDFIVEEGTNRIVWVDSNPYTYPTWGADRCALPDITALTANASGRRLHGLAERLQRNPIQTCRSPWRRASCAVPGAQVLGVGFRPLPDWTPLEGCDPWWRWAVPNVR